MHHDYQFWWFPTADASGDPPVYLYTEVDGAPSQLTPDWLADTFSARLIAEASQDVADRAKTRAFHEVQHRIARGRLAGGERQKPVYAPDAPESETRRRRRSRVG